MMHGQNHIKPNISLYSTDRSAFLVDTHCVFLGIPTEYLCIVQMEGNLQTLKELFDNQFILYHLQMQPLPGLREGARWRSG